MCFGFPFEKERRAECKKRERKKKMLGAIVRK